MEEPAPDTEQKQTRSCDQEDESIYHSNSNTIAVAPTIIVA
jgi:hypothetical protein